MKLSDLKKIAEGATPGPWHRKLEMGSFVWAGTDGGMKRICGTTRDNAKHIATFNPSLVLKLLAVVDAAEELDDILECPNARREIDSFTGQTIREALRELKETMGGDE